MSLSKANRLVRLAAPSQTEPRMGMPEPVRRIIAEKGIGPDESGVWAI